MPPLIDVVIWSKPYPSTQDLEKWNRTKLSYASLLQDKGVKVYVDHSEEDDEGVSPEFLSQNNVRFILKIVVGDSEAPPELDVANQTPNSNVDEICEEQRYLVFIRDLLSYPILKEAGIEKGV